MPKKIRISKKFSLPLDVATQSLGVVAQRGAGKTYLAAVLIEELVGAGIPVCAFDPLGVLWGLRLGADGKKKNGLPIIILGGEHGDIPLEAGAGNVIADWVVAERRPCVLDLSDFRKSEQRQFVTDFAERLYRKNRTPLHLVLDEADLFAPQRPMPGEQRMLGAFEDLVRRGRAKGIGLTLITQRPAVIHKDVLTQVSALVALRMVGPQDIKAVDGWIQSHGSAEDRKRVLNSLPSMPIGEAWFWSPGWLGVLKRIKIRKRLTYDSSKAPTVGETRIVPATLAPVDLKKLTAKMSEVIDRAKAEDPKALRRRIKELERELSKKAPKQDTAYQERLLKENDECRRRIREVERIMELTGDAIEEVGKSLRKASKGRLKESKLKPSREPERKAIGKIKKRRADGPGVDLPKGERAILIATAQHGTVTLEQLSVLTGYKRSSRDAYIQRLREKGYVKKSQRTIRVTDEGIVALGSDYEPLPTGEDLRLYWSERLPEGERRVLYVAIQSHPNPVDRETIDEETGYKRSSRDAYIQRLKARQLVTVDHGGVTASDSLF